MAKSIGSQVPSFDVSGWRLRHRRRGVRLDQQQLAYNAAVEALSRAELSSKTQPGQQSGKTGR